MKHIDKKSYRCIYDICRMNNCDIATDYIAINILKVYAYLANNLDYDDFLPIAYRTMMNELKINRSTIKDVVNWLIKSQDIVQSKTVVNEFKLA